MKILFVASANSIHIIKLCKWFAEHGHTIEIISFEKDNHLNPYAKIHTLPIDFDIATANQFRKLQYLLYGKMIRDLVDAIAPDVINIHYASSYGVAVALAGIDRKYILSVWGSDVYEFPKRSLFHRKVLEYSLNKATYIFSTSKAMMKETKKYTGTAVGHFPFGIDTDLFSPRGTREHENITNFVVGDIKILNQRYGIEYLLRALAVLKRDYPNVPWRLHIGGGGVCADELRDLAVQLGIENITVWLGCLSQEQVALEWTKFDMAVIPSDYESFGVSALEAQSCAIPLVVSDAIGFEETTRPGITSLVIPRGSVQAIVEAILQLYHDAGLRKKMGEAGRQYVLEKYDMDECYGRMEEFYENFASVKRNAFV